MRESQGASLPQRLQLTNSVNIRNAYVSILMDVARQYVWTSLNHMLALRWLASETTLWLGYPKSHSTSAD
jgi:hypothetical protein